MTRKFLNRENVVQIVLWMIILISNLFGKVQEFRFEHLSTAQGLSHNTVVKIFQDQRGFLWFGTLNGLDRYDGYNITRYRPIQGDSTSLCNNVINAIYQDQNQNLWIGTLNGLNKYNQYSDTFERFLKKENNSNSLIDNRIRCITEDYTGRLWIGTEAGLSSYDPVAGNYSNYLPDKNDPNSLSDFIIHDIYEDSRKQLWIATEGGINRFNRYNNSFSYYPYESDNQEKYGIGAAMCISEDKWGNIWVGTWGSGLQRLDINSRLFHRVQQTSKNKEQLNTDIITGIQIDSDDRMWISTYDNGLYVIPQIPRNPFSTGIEDLQHYVYDVNNENSIQSNAIWDVYMDRTGVIWTGNESGGINKCDTKQSNILHYRTETSELNSLSNNQVTSFFEDVDGNIWLGTRFGGLNKFNPINEEYSYFRYNQENKNGISSDAILSLVGDEDFLWIGTDGNGLDRYEFKTGKFTHFIENDEDENSIGGNNIFALYQDSKARLWVGTWGGGFSLFDEAMQSFINYDVDGNNVRSNVVTSIAEDTSGGLWLGTYGQGLVFFEPETEQMLFFQHDENDETSIGHNNINTVFVSQQGTLWISTMGAGMNRLESFDINTGTASFVKYDENDGLPDNIIESIIEDNDGFLWMGTSHGIARFNPKKNEVLNFSISDGFGQDVFNHGATLKTTNGLLYFGGVNGFNVFHPRSLSYNPYLPSVVITQFQIFNDPVTPKNSSNKIDTSIFSTKKINLSYRDNVFSFEFASLDFSCPEKNQYAYKMEGFDNDWRTTSANRRFVTYTNLPHGRYKFRVIASNNHGQWNRTGTSLDIFIKPPFWKTDWMLAVYIVMILGAILTIRLAVLVQERNRAQIKMKQLNAEKIHEIDQMKLRFFTHISHEFRTPLTLIIGPIERMLRMGDQMNQDKRKIYNKLVLKNARRLLRLINQLMDARKLDTGSMKLELQEKDFIAFTKAIFSVFHHRAERKNINYQFESELESLYCAFDPDKIEKVLYNLISNALKFTDMKGKITVRIKQINHITENEGSSEKISVKVEDSGIGIAQEQMEHIFDPFYQVSSRTSTRKIQGSGIGLSITKDFVEMHQGKIEVKSIVDEGSCFTFEIPLLHLSDDKTNEDSASNIKLPPEEPVDLDELPQSREDSKKPLILTVEDDKDLRQYLAMEIEDKYTIIQAPDGLSGYEMAVDRIPDLIISDVMMNVMDGYEFCIRCKNDQRTSHIPVILLTAHTAEDMRREGFKAGADDYIIKPFNPEMLKLRIDNLLETRKKLREHFSTMVYANPKEIPISSPDEKFLNKILETVENYISDTGFSVDDLSYQVGLSRAQLYRKMQGLFDHSPSEFIKNYRLQRAMKLLQKGHTPSQVCYQVGFRDPSYFSKCFKKEFGKTPQQIINENKN